MPCSRRVARLCGAAIYRGRSSVGRAREWHSRGQGFDPPRLHCLGLAGDAERGFLGCAGVERALDSSPLAGIAQLVEHNLAKVGVAGSSPVSRSPSRMVGQSDAGWSSLVARRAHNPEVVGSNPTPATPNVERGTRNAEQAPQDSLFRVTPSAFRV